MDQTCPTVRVVADNDQGFVIINAEDFDPEKHERHGEEAAAPADKTRNKPGPKPKANQDAAQ